MPTGRADSCSSMNCHLLSHVTGPPGKWSLLGEKRSLKDMLLTLVTAPLCPSSLLSFSLLPGFLRVSIVSLSLLCHAALKATELAGNGQKPKEAQS